MHTALTWYYMWHPLIGPGYQFYSGIGSDLGELTLASTLGVLAGGLYVKHQCHVDTCKRIGRHKLAGGKFEVCTRCLKLDPSVPDVITVEHIHSEHRRHLDGAMEAT